MSVNHKLKEKVCLFCTTKTETDILFYARDTHNTQQFKTMKVKYKTHYISKYKQTEVEISRKALDLKEENKSNHGVCNAQKILHKGNIMILS